MKRILSVLIGASLACCAAMQASAEEPTLQNVQLDIAQQSLNAALLAWADQTGFQLICLAPEVARALTAPKMKGAFTATGALQQLLDGTPLVYEFTSERTVTVRARFTAASHTTGYVDRVDVPHLQIASLASGDRGDQQSAEGDKPTGALATTEPRAGADRNHSARQTDVEPLEEVLVTGTHIHGAEPIGSPLIVIDRAEIERTGYATIQDVIKTLPQNVGSRDTELTGTVGGFGSDNTSYGSGIDLRGLGPDATLTLLNGRRLAPAGISSFVDVSTIPLAMVERIEIVPDGASALYGSDAIGGVVNVKLRDGYDGMETRLRYGELTNGNVPEVALSQVLGTTWDTGHMFIGYEYYERDALASSAREFTANSDLRPLGGDNFSTLESNPGNIIQIGETPTSLAIPQGQDGTALSESALLADTINYNNLRSSDELLPRHERQSAMLSVSQSVGEKLRLFADVLYSEHEYRHRDDRSGATLVIPDTNAYRQLNNLFLGAGDIVMTYDLTDDFGPATKSGLSKAVSGSLGATLQFAKSWTSELSLRYAQVNESLVQRQFVDMDALSSALGSSDLTSAFNPFADGSNTNPAVLSNLVGRLNQDSEAEVQSVHLVADGDLFAISGGTAKVAIGGEIREERYRFRDVSTSAAGIPVESFFFLPHERTVRAAFAELILPVVGESNASPALRRLDFSLSARYENYSDVGDSVAPKFGFRWSPIEDLSFKGSVGRSFKAPLLKDLGTLSEAGYFPIPAEFDPAATDDSTLTLFLGGGNRDLKPEKAETWMLGVEMAPRSLPALRLEANYFHVALKDRVRLPASTLIPIFLTPELYPGVLRRDPTDAQIGAALASVINREFVPSPLPPVEAILDFRLQNIASVDVDGIDMSASYLVPTGAGDFEMSLAGSYLLAYDEQFSSIAPSTSVASTMGRPVDLRMRGGVSWSRSGWRGSAFANYVDNYRDNLSTPNRTVGSWTTVDIQLAREFGALLGKVGEATDLSLSVTNALDKDPPFANWPTGFGFDAANADPYGRRISLEFAVKWSRR